MNDHAPHDRVSRNKGKSDGSAIDMSMVGIDPIEWRDANYEMGWKYQ